MNLNKLNVKVFAEDAKPEGIKDYIAVFHTWIQRKARPGVLIDVHDYSHMAEGPGILLVGHEGNYCVDRSDRRVGLHYFRKRGAEDQAPEAQLKSAIKEALEACQILESEAALGGRLSFDAGAIKIFVSDRLGAPNDESGQAALEPVLRGALDGLFGEGGYTLTPESDARRELGFEVKAATESSIAALLEKLN